MLGTIGLFISLLWVLTGCMSPPGSGGITDYRHVSGLTAAPVADALAMAQPYGANLVCWPGQGDRVLAYVIYRDTRPMTPIAVVDGATTYYLDSATPLPQIGQVLESSAVSITIDATVGNITQFQTTPTFDTSFDNAGTPNLTLSATSFSVDCRRIPLAEGSSTGYMVQTLYLAYQNTGLSGEIGHPASYSMMLGQKSAVSNRITLLQPPTLNLPQDGQLPPTGFFRCLSVTGGTAYQLQLSTRAAFTSATTVTVSATVVGQYAVAALDITSIYHNGLLSAAQGKPIYWRFGVKCDGQQAPVAMTDTRQNGWVYSSMRQFILPQLPPQ